VKVVLFCGGQGLRMRGAGNDLPKPMVPLGTRPILWHLMKYYAYYGHKDFILCLGYKSTTIKEFFAQYQEWISNDFVLTGGGGGRLELLRRDMEDWRITLVDTGQDANIGERLMAVRPFLKGEEMFLANYSDGLTDCPLPQIIERLTTTDAVGVCMVTRPNMSLHFVNHTPEGLVTEVLDAEQADSWINAGFFAFRQQIFDYMRPGDELVLEPFRRLIEARKLAAVPYTGFWRCCDTFKDLQTLENLLSRGPAPWELWRHLPVDLEDDVLPSPGELTFSATAAE
jgi:glucose-1-phosphate cytidylyltransferase